jgi:hypothetical protein
MLLSRRLQAVIRSEWGSLGVLLVAGCDLAEWSTELTLVAECSSPTAVWSWTAADEMSARPAILRSSVCCDRCHRQPALRVWLLDRLRSLGWSGGSRLVWTTVDAAM